MFKPRITVDLSQDPYDRWKGLEQFSDFGAQLIDYYSNELNLLLSCDNSILEQYNSDVINEEHRLELYAVANIISRPYLSVVLANAYYDALKLAFGCSAFALNTPQGVIHARNMDWYSNNRLLEYSTIIIDFINAPAGPFSVVGWPGFVGALSGIAPYRFAITLNAVLSNEQPNPTILTPLLLRSVLENAPNYNEAVTTLSNTEMTTDSLLLVSGTRQDEAVVIERTPSQSAIRKMESNYICVTNNYHNISTSANTDDFSDNQLVTTSCGRYSKMQSLISSGLPENVDEYFNVLSDPLVKMDMTCQQMVFNANLGFMDVR